MQNFTFDPLIDEGVIFVILPVFFLFLVTLEIFRKDRSRLLLRLFTNAGVTFSLAMLLLRPGYPTENNNPEAIITTENAELSTLDSIGLKGKDIYHYEDSLRDVQVPDYVNANYSKIHIVGDGMEKWDLNRLSDADINYYPSSTEGIYDLVYSPLGYVGELFEVSLSYKSDIKDSLIATIGGQGITLDSLQIIAESEEQRINFSFTPKISGNYTYEVQFRNGNSTISEILGVQIIEREPVKVLVSNEFPSFELKYLKDKLREQGIPTASRFKVGKNNYSTEFSNIKRKPIKVLSKEVLDGFDVMVTSLSSFYGLNRYERTVIEKNIESGLGLILLLDEEIKNEFPFDNVDFNVTDKSDVKVALQDSKDVLQTSSIGFQASQKLFPILVSNKNEVLAGFVIRKNGKAGFVNLIDLYALKLKGNDEEYSELILRLMDGVRRRTKRDFFTYDPLPQRRETPLKIKYTSVEESSPEIQLQSPSGQTITRYLRQSIWDDFIWEISFTPGEAGWYTIINLEDSTSLSSFFVNENEAWEDNFRNISRQNTLKASFLSKSNDHSKTISIYNRINTWIWVIIFVICTGLLWLESKL